MKCFPTAFPRDLELQRALRDVLAGAGTHFTLAEGGSSTEGIVTLLQPVKDGVLKLPDVLNAVGDFAAHTSTAGVVSLLDHDRCRHIRRLGVEGYQLNREAVCHPSETSRTIGRMMTEDLWIKVGREMLQAMTPIPGAGPSPMVEASPSAVSATEIPTAEVDASATPTLGVTALEVPATEVSISRS
jgi:hypothetical protein